MRIIAGEKRGFSLFAPAGQQTRPTLSRVRESVFSILGDRVIDARAVDLFAGAGTLGFEALSRGAEHCVFVERARPALEALRRNATKLCYNDRISIAAEDAGRWLRAQLPHAADPFTLVMADPPYGSNLAKLLEQIEAYVPLAPDAAVMIQCGVRETPPPPSRLRLARSEKYGDTAVHFYLCDAPAARVG